MLKNQEEDDDGGLKVMSREPIGLEHKHTAKRMLSQGTQHQMTVNVTLYRRPDSKITHARTGVFPCLRPNSTGDQSRASPNARLSTCAKETGESGLCVRACATPARTCLPGAYSSLPSASITNLRGVNGEADVALAETP